MFAGRNFGAARSKGMTDKTFSELLMVGGMANETNALVGGYQAPTGQPRDL